MAGKGDGAVDIEEELLLNCSNSDGGGGDERSNSSFVEGVVDYRGERVSINNRRKFGGWRSASLMIVVEILQMFVYFGITSNLISYLTGPLRQSTAVAAASVNAWVGSMWMLPLLSAVVADSYLGRFRTILFSSLVYILGLALLTLSAVLPSLRPPSCPNNSENNASCTSPSSFQVIFFFTSLFLIAIGNAGYKPCAQAFGPINLMNDARRSASLRAHSSIGGSLEYFLVVSLLT